jgi:hypothetical protein
MFACLECWSSESHLQGFAQKAPGYPPHQNRGGSDRVEVRIKTRFLTEIFNRKNPVATASGSDIVFSHRHSYFCAMPIYRLGVEAESSKTKGPLLRKRPNINQAFGWLYSANSPAI